LLPMSCHRGRHDRARRPPAGQRTRGPLFLGPDPRRRRQHLRYRLLARSRTADSVARTCRVTSSRRRPGGWCRRR
jgi:hypothetical protein